jgi:hypothetical protein
LLYAKHIPARAAGDPKLKPRHYRIAAQGGSRLHSFATSLAPSEQPIVGGRADIAGYRRPPEIWTRMVLGAAFPLKPALLQGGPGRPHNGWGRSTT